MNPKQYKQMMEHLTRPAKMPGKMKVAQLDNVNTPDLDQTPDSILRPGETLEDFDVTFRRPNADGGRIPFDNGGGLTKQKLAAERYGMTLKKYQSLSQQEKTRLKDKAKREALNAKGILVDGKNVSKNIRELPNGTFRFETQVGGGIDKIFPKGTTLKQVEDFRDKYLKKFGIEKGKFKKGPNPKIGKYKSVEGQKHIKFNGVTYQVDIQRGDQKPFYTSDFDKAVEKRDQLVKKFPPKTMTDYNIKEKPKKINAEILELSKNPKIKNIFKTGELTDEAITEAANILKVNKATAIDRLEDLATAYSGDRKNVPGIKPDFIENARKIAASLPGAKTKAGELATGVPFIGESISVPKKEIGRKANYPTDIFDIDEARATTTGLKRGTSPYSIFGQIIDRNVNRVAKGGFGGAGWDSRAGTLEAKLDDAIKNFGPNSKEAKAAKVKYNQEATKFENEVNRKKLRGAKRVRIPRISLDAPSKTIARYKDFTKEYQNIFNENFVNKKYSFVIPKDLRTIPELRKEVLNPKSSTYKTMINLLKEGFNEYDEKKLFQKINKMTPDAVKKILKRIPRIAQVDDFETNRFASADNIMTSGVEYVDDAEKEKNFIQRNPFTTAAGTAAAAATTETGRNILKRLARGAFTPTGIALQTAGLGGLDLTTPAGRLSLGAEAAFAPELVKASIGATRGMKNRTLQKGIQRVLNLGLKTPTALRLARIASPIGIASLGAEGLYQAGKFTKKRIGELRAMSPEQRQELRRKGDEFAFSEFAAAGGGIAKEAGDPSGAMLESMNPDSQGLPGLLKRGRKG